MTEPVVWKRIWNWPWLPIAVLVLTNLVIGLLVVRDYGLSTDEPKIYQYSTNSLNNYTRVIQGLPAVDFNNGYLDYYGPAFFMAAGLLARASRFLHLAISRTDVWHFSYFLVFQIGVVSLFALARRWMSAWAAFGAALLFSTQPVLWGHAFINPKDIPFMAAFLASLALGFSMLDRFAVKASFPEIVWPGSFRLKELYQAIIRPIAAQAWLGFKAPVLLLAAAALGLTTSVRLLGPYAGIIVILYGLIKCRRRLPGLLVPYGLMAILVSYLTWPFLWANPRVNFIQSLVSMSRFPWLGSVLFEGKVLPATQLPARYLPEMLSIQLTEPLLLLFFGGAAIAVWLVIKQKISGPILLLVVWLLVPMVALILAGSTLYNGFRQVLFLLPPIFICAGLALDWLFGRIRRKAVRVLILFLAVAPGIIAIVSLHPYEYIYYNALVGGVGGAAQKYDLDYWGTSYREAADYINKTAPSGANVVVFGPVETFSPFARSDLRVLAPDDARALTAQGKLSLNYAAFLSRQNKVVSICPGGEIEQTIQRDGAILAVVKKIPTGEANCP